MKANSKNRPNLKLDNAPIKLVFTPFDVSAKLAEGEACGGWDEKFRCALSLEAEDLDSHGFIVENLTVIKAIRHFFKGRMYQASCEQLCQCIAHVVHALAPDRLTRIHVKVYNLTGHLELDWRQGQTIPPLAEVAK